MGGRPAQSAGATVLTGFQLKQAECDENWMRARQIVAAKGVNDCDNNFWRRDIRTLAVQLL